MGSELFFENKKFISAKTASSLSGYSQDYIGQLCRANKIESRRIGRVWFVSEESILNHKKFSNEFVPPKDQPPELKTLVSTKEPSVSIDKNLPPLVHKKTHFSDYGRFVNKVFSKRLTPLTLCLILTISTLFLKDTTVLRASEFISSAPMSMYGAMDEIVSFYSDSLREKYIKLGKVIINKGSSLTKNGIDVIQNPPTHIVGGIKTISKKEISFVNTAATESVQLVSNVHYKIFSFISDSVDGLADAKQNFGGVKTFTANALDSLNPFDKTGLLVYQKINDLFNRYIYIPTTEMFSVPVIPPALTILPPEIKLKEKENAVPVKIVNTTQVIEKTIERVAQADISSKEVDLRLEILNNKLMSEFSRLSSGGNTVIRNVYQQIAQSQKIDNLYNTVIRTPTITNGSISGTSVSATSLSANTISAGATTLSGLLSFIGTGHAGLKLNNLTTTERNLLTPASGMTFFNTTLGKMQVYNGTTWKNVGNPEVGEEVTGGTTGSVLFVDSSNNLAQDNSNFFWDDTNNRLGISTSTPGYPLSVTGGGFFDGGTVTAANLVATSSISISGTSGLSLTGDGAGLTFSGSGNHDVVATGGTLRFGSNVVIGNIQALDNTINIGTPAVRFKTIYADEVNAATLVGTLSGGNLTAETFNINSDNATNDTENSYLAFERGSAIPNALLTWDATLDTFDFNQPLFIQTDSATTTITTLDLRGASGQTASLFNVASSSETSYFNITSSGNVGIGTTTPDAQLNILGATSQAVDNLKIKAGTSQSGYTFSVYDSADNYRFLISSTGVQYTYNAAHTAYTTTGVGYSQYNAATPVILFYDLANVPQSAVLSGESSQGNGTLTLQTATTGVLTDKVTINSSGNVGIGTTGPVSKQNIVLSYDYNASASTVSLANSFLHLGGGEYGVGRYYLTTYGYSRSMTNPSSYIGAIGVDASGIGTTALVFGTRDAVTDIAPSERMRIDRAGNVGIASTTPWGLLSVNPNGIGNGPEFVIGSSSATHLVVNNQGNVGIGTTVPTSRLDVRSSVSGTVVNVQGLASSGSNYGVAGGTTGSNSTLNVGVYAYASEGLRNYGLQIPANFPPAGANNYAIYADSQAQSYFAGNVGIGTTEPTAKLHVAAGTATVAPLKLTSGTLLTTPETGAMEFLTDDVYHTLTIGGPGGSMTSDYPPSQDDTYVKTTTNLGAGYEGYKATDPAQSLTGAGPGWYDLGSITNRFHIDLGSAKTITKIYYENSHSSGGYTNRGTRGFTLWGSNNAEAFATLTYATDTNWTQLTTDVTQFDQHVAADTADPKYIYVTNAVAYRYYAIKISSNYGGNIVGLRRIELQEGTSPSRRVATVLTNGTNLTSGRVPFATTNGRLTDSSSSVIMTNSGVGIGINTPDPLAPLHVTGSAYVTNNGYTAVMSGWSGIAAAYFGTLGGYGMGIGSTSFPISISTDGSTTAQDGIINFGNSTHRFASAYFGNTISGSATTQFLWLGGTWNTTGVVDGALRLAVTETASGAGSQIMSVYGGAAGATSYFSILKGGNVGIGTTSPGTKLHVKQSANGQVAALDNSAGNYSWLALKTNGSDRGYLSWDFNDAGNSFGSAMILNSIAGKLHLWDNSGTGITISSGNVGIGTTVPGAKLDVNGGALIQGLSVGLGANAVAHNTVLGLGALDAATLSGDYNVAIGSDALTTLTSGNRNIAIGHSALGETTTGSYNVAVGMGALTKNTSNNTAIGFWAATNSTGTDNSAYGYYALTTNTTGAYNTAIGGRALYTQSTGSNNVALGYYAGAYETSSNSFYVNNVDQTNTAGDKAYSLLYGTFSGVAGSLTGQQLVINGNVGIGTTTPAYKLDVMGGIASYGSSFFGGSIVATSTLNVTGLATFVSASTTNIGSTGSAYFATTNGNVGIGTAEPTSLLQLLGTSANQLRVGYDSSNYSTLGVANDGATTLTTNGAAPNLNILLNSSGYLSVNNGALYFDGANKNLAINNSASTNQFEVAIPTGVQSNAIPIMTSATTPSGIVTASTQNITPAWRAFDDTANTWFTNGALPDWLAYEFPTPKTIVRYSFSNPNFYYSKNWTFEGWTGSQWVVLDTRINQTFGTIDYTFINTTAYIKYRINITDIYHSLDDLQMQVESFQMFEASSYTPAFAVGTTGNVGIGTTTPWGLLSVNPNGIGNGPQFTIGSSTKTDFVVTNSGNVGIGTTGPNGLLDVRGANSPTTGLIVGTTAAGVGVGVRIHGSASAGGTARIFADPWSTPGALALGTFANQDSLFIATTGNVGIGTTTSQYLLTPFSSTAPQLALSAGAGLSQWTMRNAGGNFYLSTTTTDGTATTTTSALTILNGGNVGIGTTEPIYKLDMGGGSNSYLNSIRIGGALIGGHSGTDYDYIGWNIAPASVGGTYTYSMPNQNAAGSIIKFGAGGFQFLTAPSGTGGDSATLTSRMNMTAGGDLAIGTTATASWRVHIEKSSDTVVGSGTFWNYDGGGGLFIRNPSNTINATAGIGFALGTANTSGAGIAAIEESTTLGALGFFTGGSGTSNSFPERMRITSGGNVGIGTTTPWGLLSVNPNGIGNGPEFVVGSSTTTHLVVTNNGNVGIGTTGPIYKLDVAGAASRFTGSAVSGEDDPVIRVWNPVDDDNVRGLVRFYRKAAETNVGLISASNTTTSYVTSSDARLKENINQTLLGLDVLSKIQVRDYNFIADPTSRVQGFIAQELFKVYPQAVYVPENEEDYWGIDYGKLTPLLVKGIQELSIRTAGLSSATTTPSLIIMDNGNVGVGTSTPASKFHVFSNITSGGVAVFSDANASCTIDPTNASMSCTSDQSLKKDIETLNASTTLEKIMALRPVSYRWNGEGDSWEGQTFPKHQGFIAQEVEAIFPEFVTTSADGKKSIAYSNFIPAMVQAIQTINSKVNAIDTRLTNLETLIASTPTTAGGLTFTQIMEEFVNQFEIIGVKFMNGIAYFKNIFTDELTVGTSVKPSGITLYDEVTNEPYCLKMKNGAMVSLAGECTNAVATTTPDTATTTPDAVPQTTDTSSPVISIISDNPAVVTVGTHYSDMGATVTDMGVNSLDLTGPLVRNDNLGLHYTVDGISLNEVSIDTSTSTIHTVVYSVVDGSGNWGYATRTVEVITQ